MTLAKIQSRLRDASFLVLVAASIGCGPTGTVTIEDAQAMILEDTGSMYLSIHNGTQEAITVLAFRSNISDSVSLHETRTEGDMVRMVERDSPLRIEPGSTVELAPGGLHLMLRSPHSKQDGAEHDEAVTLSLDLDNGETLEVNPSVSSMAGGNHHHGH